VRLALKAKQKKNCSKITEVQIQDKIINDVTANTFWDLTFSKI